jgi:hypothetical protein
LEREHTNGCIEIEYTCAYFGLLKAVMQEKRADRSSLKWYAAFTFDFCGGGLGSRSDGN